MAIISTNKLARAIYESSLNKNRVEIDVVVQNAVKLISQKHLMNKSKEIIASLEKILDRNEEIVRAKISSRVKLEKKIVDEIEDIIKKRYKAKNTVLEFEVDEKLLGGIKIEVGDEIIDTTLKSKIHKLENYLITQ